MKTVVFILLFVLVTLSGSKELSLELLYALGIIPFLCFYEYGKYLMTPKSSLDINFYDNELKRTRAAKKFWQERVLVGFDLVSGQGVALDLTRNDEILVISQGTRAERAEFLQALVLQLLIVQPYGILLLGENFDQDWLERLALQTGRASHANCLNDLNSGALVGSDSDIFICKEFSQAFLDHFLQTFPSCPVIVCCEDHLDLKNTKTLTIISGENEGSNLPGYEKTEIKFANNSATYRPAKSPFRLIRPIKLHG